MQARGETMKLLTCLHCKSQFHSRPGFLYYCSDECRHLGQIQRNAQYRRRLLWERDRGICSACGMDTEPIAERLRHAFNHDPTIFEHLRRALRLPRLRASRGSVWDADHIQPKCLGGTNDLENYRTVCVWCHRKITGALIGQLGGVVNFSQRRDEVVYDPEWTRL
jgi:hypothetical protein